MVLYSYILSLLLMAETSTDVVLINKNTKEIWFSKVSWIYAIFINEYTYLLLVINVYVSGDCKSSWKRRGLHLFKR